MPQQLNLKKNEQQELKDLLKKQTEALKKPEVLERLHNVGYFE